MRLQSRYSEQLLLGCAALRNYWLFVVSAVRALRWHITIFLSKIDIILNQMQIFVGSNNFHVFRVLVGQLSAFFPFPKDSCINDLPKSVME